MIHTTPRGVIGVAVRPLINFSVAMFVFCSGYLTKLEIKDIKEFYKKRILRVLIPYVIWSIIYTVAYGSYSTFAKNLLTANVITPFYYLFVYMQFVLLTPIIGKLLKSKYSWIGGLITPISIIIIRYIWNFLGLFPGFPFPGTVIFVWFAYYYMGMALGNDMIEFTLDYKKAIALYGLFLLLSWIEGSAWFLFGNYDMATTQIRLTSFLTSTAACLLAYLFLRDEKIMVQDNHFIQVLIKIGDCSFGIYLSHYLIMSALGKIPGYGLLPFPLTSVLIVAVTTAGVIVGNKMLGKRLSKYLGVDIV